MEESVALVAVSFSEENCKDLWAPRGKYFKVPEGD